MAKLLHILAASVGGGIVLGASIRLGEVIGASDKRRRPRGRGAERAGLESVPAPYKEVSPATTDQILSARLDRLEERVARIHKVQQIRPAGEWQTALAEVVDRMDRQQADVDSMRQQMSAAISATSGHLESAGAIATHLRDDLRRELSEDLDRRLEVVEEQLHLSLKAANRDTVSAMLASIEARVTPRISRMETEIGEQAAAVTELRECSLESERSIQRLLAVLERVMAPKTGANGGAATAGEGPGGAFSEPRADEFAAGGAAQRQPVVVR